MSISSWKMCSLPWHQLIQGKNMQRRGMVSRVWSSTTLVTTVLGAGMREARSRKSSLEGSAGVARLQPPVPQGHVAGREAHAMG